MAAKFLGDHFILLGFSTLNPKPRLQGEVQLLASLFAVYMSCSLKSLKGVCIRKYIGQYDRAS